MTDGTDNLTSMPAMVPPSQGNVSLQDSSNGQIDLGETSVASAEAEVEYQIKCPEHVPAEEVKAHIEAFKAAGVDAKTAQKIVDRLAQHGEENDRRYVETLDKSLNDDKKALQQEFGSEYDRREQDISRYFYQENIADEDVQSLVSTWGFQKTFKFFDRYAQMNKESSAGGTFARSEGFHGTQEDYDKSFNSPEFAEKRRNQDPDANKKIRDWALQQATLNQ